MEPQPLPPAPSTPPAPASFPETKPPDIKASLLIIMAVCLLIATGLAGLFYFQIQKLSKELMRLQTKPTPTPLSTEIPAKEDDPTVDWKTYTNTKYGYAVKYPSDWSISCPSQPCDSTAMFSVTKQPIGLDIIVKQKAQVVTSKDAFSKAIATQILSQQEMLIDSIG